MVSVPFKVHFLLQASAIVSFKDVDSRHWKTALKWNELATIAASGENGDKTETSARQTIEARLQSDVGLTAVNGTAFLFMFCVSVDVFEGKDWRHQQMFHSAELKMIFSVALFVINEEEQEYVALFLPVYGRIFHNAQHLVKTRKSQWVTRPCDFTDYYVN